MFNEKIEKIAEILAFVLHLMGGEAFSKTKLAKLLYLLDVVTSRQGISKFSGIEYKSYYYGPYSDNIEDGISLLTELGCIAVNKSVNSKGNPYYHFKLNYLPSFGHLTNEEKVKIKQIVSQLMNRDISEILELTYSTKEYKETPFGEVISL